MRFFLVKRPRTILGIFPVEILVVSFGLLAGILSAHFNAPLFHPFRLYRERIFGLVPMYLTGLLLLFLILRLRVIRKFEKPSDYVSFHATWEHFRQHALEKSRVIRDVRFMHVACCCFVVFIALKHLIPSVIAARNYDSLFMMMEKRFFGGELGSVLLIKALGPSVAPLLSSGYMLFYPYVAVLIFLMIFQADEVLAHRFFFAFVLLWFLGILFVYAVPTWGPVFHQPHLFAGLPDTEVKEMQERLWRAKIYMDKHPGNARMPFLISGFPSLHFGVVVLGTIFLARVHRWLAVASALIAVVTLLSTIYFGWHYVVDDVAGAALAAWCFFASQRTVDSTVVFVEDERRAY